MRWIFSRKSALTVGNKIGQDCCFVAYSHLSNKRGYILRGEGCRVEPKIKPGDKNLCMYQAGKPEILTIHQGTKWKKTVNSISFFHSPVLRLTPQA